MHDPGGPCSGLIALRLDGHESADAVAHLAERDVLVRPIPDTPFVRVSIGAWTDDADIEALAAGLAVAWPSNRQAGSDPVIGTGWYRPPP